MDGGRRVASFHVGRNGFDKGSVLSLLLNMLISGTSMEGVPQGTIMMLLTNNLDREVDCTAKQRPAYDVLIY